MYIDLTCPSYSSTLWMHYFESLVAVDGQSSELPEGLQSNDATDTPAKEPESLPPDGAVRPHGAYLVKPTRLKPTAAHLDGHPSER